MSYHEENEPELEETEIHLAGTEGKYLTRKTDHPVRIDPPVSNPGPLDTRDGNFDIKRK